MADTKIEWCSVPDGQGGFKRPKVWNMVRGCLKKSAGCQNCWGMKQAHRFSGPGRAYEGLTKLVPGKGPQWTGEVRCVPEKLDEPLKWRDPCGVFAPSMSDLFHPKVPWWFVDKVMAVMALTPQHTYMTLTKRADLMAAYFNDLDCKARICEAIEDHPEWKKRTRLPVGNLRWPLRNLWPGISVENQATAEARIPHLLRTPAAVRWLSIEPLISLVDLEGWMFSFCRAEHGECGRLLGKGSCPDCLPTKRTFDQIVVGCESGPNARPTDTDWIRNLRDQCRAAGTPFFLKQRMIDGKLVKMPELDGKVWDEYPTTEGEG